MASLTRAVIKNRFWKLLEEKPLSKITVQMIADCCGINRNSFYYHFQDIPELARVCVAEQLEEIMDAYVHESVETCQLESYRCLFANKKAILNIYHSANRESLELAFMQLCDRLARKYLEIYAGELDGEASVYYVRTIRYCLFGHYVDWLNHEMKEDYRDYTCWVCRKLEQYLQK